MKNDIVCSKSNLLCSSAGFHEWKMILFAVKVIYCVPKCYKKMVWVCIGVYFHDKLLCTGIPNNWIVHDLQQKVGSRYYVVLTNFVLLQ